MANFHRIRYPTSPNFCHKHYGDPIVPPLAPYIYDRKNSVNKATSKPLSEVPIDNNTSSTSSGSGGASSRGNVDTFGLGLFELRFHELLDADGSSSWISLNLTPITVRSDTFREHQIARDLEH